MITASATVPAISVSVTICAQQTINSIMVKNYISTASTTQTFAGFEGKTNITVIAAAIGVMGHLSGLDSSHKLITGWNSSTAVCTFKSTLPAGIQITVIESTN